MKTFVKGIVVAMLAIPGMAMAETAPAPDPSCYQIHYNLEFLNAHPHAPAICEEVKEIDGLKYVRMSATVVKKYKGYTTVAFKDVFGNKLDNLQFDAVEGSTVMVNDKEVSWSDLNVGDKLTFWLPEGATQVVGQPGRGKAGAPIVFKAVAE